MKDVHVKTLVDKSEHTVPLTYKKPITKFLSTIISPIKKIEGVVVDKDTLLKIFTNEKVKLLTLKENNCSVRGKLTKKEVLSFVTSRLKENIPN